MTLSGRNRYSMASANANGDVVNVKSVDINIINTKRQKMSNPFAIPLKVSEKIPHSQYVVPPRVNSICNETVKRISQRSGRIPRTKKAKLIFDKRIAKKVKTANNK